MRCLLFCDTLVTGSGLADLASTDQSTDPASTDTDQLTYLALAHHSAYGAHTLSYFELFLLLHCRGHCGGPSGRLINPPPVLLAMYTYMVYC